MIYKIRPIANHTSENGFRTVPPPVSPKLPKAKLDIPSPKWKDGVVPKAPSPLPYGQPAIRASLQVPDVTVSPPEKPVEAPNNVAPKLPRTPSPGPLMVGGGFDFRKPVNKVPSSEKGKGKSAENGPMKVRNRRSSSFSEGQMEVIETAKLAYLEAEKLVREFVAF